MTQPQASQALVIRPTLKRAWFGLIIALAFLAGILWVWWKIVPEWPWPVGVIAALPLLGPLVSFIDSRRTRLEIYPGSAKYIRGIFSETTRNLVLRNVSDVRVERSFAQRLWGIGTLIIDIPGEDGRVVMQDVDHAQQAAEALVRAARSEGASTRNV
jgi:uncharacterized membrane protein YdbT with pleckstrin-like domain